MRRRRNILQAARSALAIALMGASAGVAASGGQAAAHAQAPAAPPPASEDEVVRQRLEDAETSFRFAQRAASRGDLRGAIAALERVLLINPSLDNVKMELGLLYLRAGRADLAVPFLEAATASPAADPQVRRRALEALRQSRGADSAHAFSGSLFLGLQSESNPNAAPDGVFAPGFGGGAIFLPAEQLSISADSDFAVLASGNGGYAFRLPGQSGHELAADLSLSSVNYNDNNALSSLVASLRAGPRFYFGGEGGLRGLVRPFVTASTLRLDSEEYFTSVGGGIESELRPALGLGLRATLQSENRAYVDSSQRPQASLQTGVYWSGGIGADWRPLAATTLSADIFGESGEARVDFESRERLGGRLAASQVITPLRDSPSWRMRAAITYSDTSYDAADPGVGLGLAREEQRLEGELGLSIPLTQRLALDLRVSQTRNDANIANFEYDNTLGAAGLVFRF